MYEVEDDKIYCYPGTTVLKNKLDLKDAAELAAFEAEISSQRASEPLPEGQLDAAHYTAVHHHLFQDVYDWAGEIRKIRIGKGGNWFCFPEHIDRQMEALFGWLADENYLSGLDAAQFAAKAAHLLAEMNAIHPSARGTVGCSCLFLCCWRSRPGIRSTWKSLSPRKYWMR